jgi:GOST, seven transmembrane domain
VMRLALALLCAALWLSAAGARAGRVVWDQTTLTPVNPKPQSSQLNPSINWEPGYGPGGSSFGVRFSRAMYTSEDVSGSFVEAPNITVSNLTIHKDDTKDIPADFAGNYTVVVTIFLAEGNGDRSLDDMYTTLAKCEQLADVIPTDKGILLRKSFTVKGFPTIVAPADKLELRINKTGMYYVWVTACHGGKMVDYDTNPTWNADFVMTCAYGFLPGSQYWFLHFYGILALCYLLGLLPYWIDRCFRHRKELLELQKWLFVVIVFSFAEAGAMWIDLLAYNGAGENFLTVMGFGAFFSACKHTVSRVLVLVLCLGYGVAKPTLGVTTNVRVGLLAFVYLIFSGIYGIVDSIAPRSGGELASQFILLTVVAALEAIWYYWTFISLIRTLALLQTRQQTVKLTMYRRFLFCLVAAGLVMFVLKSIELWVLSSKNPDAWRTLVGLGITRALLYVAVLVFIVVLWRPTENNTRYAYRPVDEGDDDAEIVLSSMSPETPGKRAHGSTSGHDRVTVVDNSAGELHTGVNLDSTSDDDVRVAFDIGGLSDDEVPPDAKMD